MKITVQVLASRTYSFPGDRGDTVNLVESTIEVNAENGTVIGKLNQKGSVPLAKGFYTASIRAAEKAGKLILSLGEFVPTTAPGAASYAAASK